MFGELASLRGNQGRRYEVPRTLGMYCAEILSLPGLVGFWPMGSVQRSTGNAYDLSGQGRTMTYNGNPVYDQFAVNGTDLFIPYIDMDGVGDYLSRADETDLDILGTETIYAAAVRGLTMGGWWWFDNLARNDGLISKWGGGGQNAYALQKQAAGDIVRAIMTTDGATLVSASMATAVTASAWHYFAFRFTPSTELACWQDAEKATNVVGIPASIFNSNAALEIGRLSGAQNLDGRAALIWLCAQTHSDWRIESLYRWGRHLFGV